MKKFDFLFFIALIISGTLCAQSAKYVYLSDIYTPTDYHAFKKAKDISINHCIYMGGVEYTRGFQLSCTYGPTKLGYVEYSLKGKYKYITFIIGSSQPKEDNYSVGNRKCAVKISGDGKKIQEILVQEFDVPKRVKLDISGVDKLKFEIILNDVCVGIANPVLWTAQQKPLYVGKLSNASGKPMMLVRDYRPYILNNYHRCVSQNEKYTRDLRSVKINGKTYSNGIALDATIQLIGSDERCSYFNLDGKYSTLTFKAGPQDSDNGNLGVAWLTIKGDGKILLEEEIGEGNIAKAFTVDIKNCKMLSVESKQSKGTSALAVADMMVYPEGYELANNEEKAEYLEVSDKVKSLPDVCKLVSNIEPYAVGGGISRENMVYNGSSDYYTFSMGGIKFNEGLILKSSTNVLNDNTGSHALFNLEGQFDYISFTTGWISKCGVLKNDVLEIYADTQLVFQMPLIATSENQYYEVPIYKCRKLSFIKKGIVSLDHPAFGVADIVLYRGKPVKNDLFVHPKPECPNQIDLIDLSKPYIHYAHSLKDHQSELLKDGSTKKDYFTMPDGKRINKGFVLATSVHFSLDMGPGSNPSVGVTAGMLGGSMMVGMVGGTVISAVCPFGALIALASGGTAHESSCAAFNTWGEYDNVTFTVACLKKEDDGNGFSLKSTPIDTLLIGADGEVIKTIQVHDNMKPTTYTVPIKKARQLMFWLQCGNWNSGIFIFYDLVLSKGNSEVALPSVNKVNNHSEVVAPVNPFAIPIADNSLQTIEWSSPKLCGVDAVDNYFKDCKKAINTISEFYNKLNTNYFTKAIYIQSSTGVRYRAFSIVNNVGKEYGFSEIIAYNDSIIKSIESSNNLFVNLNISKVNAGVGLIDLGFDGIAYGKYVNNAAKIMKQYKNQLDTLKKNKEEENKLLRQLISQGLTIDGVPSNDKRIFIK